MSESSKVLVRPEPDRQRAEKIRNFLSQLECSEHQTVLKCLVDIRTKFAVADGQKSKSLVSHGLIEKLLPLLERPNSKIVDITLSILGNLTLHKKPRAKLLEIGGAGILYKILTTLVETNIIGRTARDQVVGNSAQDDEFRVELLNVGVLGALVKNLAEVCAPAAKSSIIRALRVLGCHDVARAREIWPFNVVASVGQCLASDFDELIKATVKFLASFSALICSYELAEQIQGADGQGFNHLVRLCASQKSSIWESSISTLINLSQLENLRPVLGNAGVVEAIIQKINLYGASMKTPSYSRGVRALCRYTRESVNRVKLRELGGLKIFVRVLKSRSGVDRDLHDVIIQCIKNFAYDNTSLIVLQNEGLIFSLVQFIDDFVEQNFHQHCCEVEICENDETDDTTTKHDVNDDANDAVTNGEVDNDDEDDELSRLLSSATQNVTNRTAASNVDFQKSTRRKRRFDELTSGEDGATAPTATSSYASRKSIFDIDDEIPPPTPILDDAKADADVDDAKADADVDDDKADADLDDAKADADLDDAKVDVDAKDTPSVEVSESRNWRQFRVNSPSYQAIQDEMAAFSRLRNHYSFLSPAVSSFTSTFSSPERFSPPESFQSSPYQSPGRSDLDSSDMEMYSEDGGNEHDGEDRYSPVEFLSDDDNEGESEETVQGSSTSYAAATSATNALNTQTYSPSVNDASQPMASTPPPPTTTTAAAAAPQTTLPKLRPQPSAPLSPLQYLSPSSPPTASTSASKFNFCFQAYHSLNESNNKSSNDVKDECRMSQVLQLLSRLTQFESPHENLYNLKTTQAIVRYLCHTRKPLSRAERILLRLSKNLYCLMPFIQQCQLSWVKLETEARPTLPDSLCGSCQNLQNFTKEVLQNFSYLAETGYAEGAICHKLVKGSEEDKKTIAVSIPIIIRPRKLLRNVLLTHGGLDVLMEVLERETSSVELFSNAVLSVKLLSEHVGIVSPELKLFDALEYDVICSFEDKSDLKDLIVKLDSLEIIEARRDVLSKSSSVFDAMLNRDFAESTKPEILIKMASKSAVLALFHHLYGCRNCDFLENLDVDTLIELVSLSDKFLLPDLNRVISSRVVRQCLETRHVVRIYEKSLEKCYPVLGIDENLSVCAVCFVLVGNFSHAKRVEIFRELLTSKMASDFADDVNKSISFKLSSL